MQATGVIILIALYYLLICGEYTSPHYVQRRNVTLKRATHTNLCMVGDVVFW